MRRETFFFRKIQQNEIKIGNVIFHQIQIAHEGCEECKNYVIYLISSQALGICIFEDENKIRREMEIDVSPFYY